MTRRPAPSEYPARYGRYVDLVPEVDLLRALEDQFATTGAFLQSIPRATWDYRYAEGKWTALEVFGHILDTERIFAFRALTFGRGDTTALFPADQDLYVRNAEVGRLSLEELWDEWVLTRRSNIELFRHAPAAAWDRTGTLGGTPITVRGIGYVMLGHERYHLGVIGSRYLGQRPESR